MAAKKKAKKKAATSKKKPTGIKKPSAKRATLKSSVKKKQAKKKTTKKVAASKRTIRKAVASATSRASTKRAHGESETVNALLPGFQRASAPSGRQAGDLQGLSDVEGADSESVDELLDEGNAFEADAVRGVEDADNADESEVHTHEVPEDDVPDEYLKKD